jgi:AraC family transcriptional regulator of adaptative response/methylated-DNA-[protein]-cysteine methyltransferase
MAAQQPAITSENVQIIEELCRYIDAHFEEQLTLELLAAQAGMNPTYLQKTFKKLTGLSPKQYLEARRVASLKNGLKEKPILDAMLDSGISSTGRLYEKAADHLGMTPREYQMGGARATIRYTMADSPLGRILLAATETGICVVCLGDDDKTLLEFLTAEYPKATLEQDDQTLHVWLTELLNHLEGTCPHLELPLDVRATAFQWKVWQELLKIPYGETRTYQEIATSLGNPKASRAVARACATNPVSVVIPCHRVIRGDGSPGGYRWGLNRKRRLLKKEKAARKQTTDPG